MSHFEFNTSSTSKVEAMLKLCLNDSRYAGTHWTNPFKKVDVNDTYDNYDNYVEFNTSSTNASGGGVETELNVERNVHPGR